MPSRSPRMAAILHVAADVFLIAFGSAFAALLLFAVMVIGGAGHD